MKNSLIVILAVLAVYLTSQLWFENFSGRNFFYRFLNAYVTAPALSGENSFGQPYRLIIGLGGNSFIVRYNNLSAQPVKRDCDEIISDVLKQGEFIAMRETSDSDARYDEIFNSRCYLYDYYFDMPMIHFAAAFSQKNSALVSRISTFNCVALIPVPQPDGSYPGEKTIVCFLDEMRGVIYEYESKKNLAPPSGEAPPLVYESSRLSGYSFMSSHAFIAKFSQGVYSYPAIQVINPYAGTELLMGAIEKNVDSFFVNPAAKVSFVGENNVYTFIDENTVVKYYKNDVLDYANYKTVSVNATFLQNYEAAVRFIRNDPLVTNEYYLAGYESEEEKKITFYFDYAINDLPLLLPDGYRSSAEAPIGHAIEITVDEENVARYRKLVYTYLQDSYAKTAASDFNAALRFVAEPDGASASPLSGVVLGYKMDRSKQAFLYWVLWLQGGGSFSQNAQ
ncbi:MAG: hypothetical protein LBT44_06365 [Clostridiales bacterium]|nr:hypothetical protein [Clostridiales bacterium]